MNAYAAGLVEPVLIGDMDVTRRIAQDLGRTSRACAAVHSSG
jgi:hypothetical protein